MTWPESVTQLVEEKTVAPRSYDLQMTYDDWNMRMCVWVCDPVMVLTCPDDILKAILPDAEEESHETPGGFAIAGHVGKSEPSQIIMS